MVDFFLKKPAMLCANSAIIYSMETLIKNHIIKKLDIKNKENTKQVLTLQIASYSVEAKLIGNYDIPPLKDTIDSLTCCGEIFYGYIVDDVLAGIISYKLSESVVDIHRVAVHPDFFRQGIADILLKFLEKININANKIIVSTGQKNQPAKKLYYKNGYQRIRDIEVEKGVYLTQFEKLK